MPNAHTLHTSMTAAYFCEKATIRQKIKFYGKTNESIKQ